MKMNYIGSLCLVALLTACGGGGGGSSEPPITASSSSIANTIVANAGADITVNEGEKVNLNPVVVVVNPTGFTSGGGNLEITGSSTKASDIVKLKWTLQKGVLSGVSTTDTTSGRFSFVAPDTGSNVSAEIIYQLTLTNAAGQTASDTVTITINRVNTLPLVNAGIDQSVESESQVTLSGTASDAEGGLKSYVWVQKTGAALTLTNADKATASFMAPSVNEPTTYEFELTVADADDATAIDKIIVTVNPKNMPFLSVKYPLSGIYNSNPTTKVLVAASGVDGAVISTVTVDLGGALESLSFVDGFWQLESLSIPEFADTLDIKVKAVDSKGITAASTVTLKKSDAEMGVGSTWKGTSAITLNYDSNILYAVTDSGRSISAASDVKLISIDLKNNNKQVVSAFNAPNFGPSLFPVRSAIWARDTTKIYGVVSTSGSSGTAAILSIDTQTGMREIISDSAHGTGNNFSNPVGIAYTDANTPKLFVTDNGASSIVTVDVATGNRTTASNENFSYLISIPDGNLDLYTAPNFNGNTPFYTAPILAYAAGGTSTFPTRNIFSQAGNKGDGPDPSTPLKALFGKTRTDVNKAIVIDAANRIFEIDILTGNRELLFTNSNKITAATLHTFYDVLFISEDDGDRQAIAAVDLTSGAKVIIVK